MNITLKALTKELNRLEKRLLVLGKKSNMNALGKATRSFIGENTSLKRYMDSDRKNDGALKMAAAWNIAKTKYIKLSKEQTKHNYWISEIVSINSDISELQSKIYHERKRDAA